MMEEQIITAQYSPGAVHQLPEGGTRIRNNMLVRKQVLSIDQETNMTTCRRFAHDATPGIANEGVLRPHSSASNWLPPYSVSN